MASLFDIPARQCHGWLVSDETAVNAHLERLMRANSILVIQRVCMCMHEGQLSNHACVHSETMKL